MSFDKALIIAITTLAGVVAYLFRLYVSRNKEITSREEAMASERHAAALERAVISSDHKRVLEKIEAEHRHELDVQARQFELQEAELRADHEKQWRETIERYDSAARRESEIFRAHEDQVRKEFTAIMEKVSDSAEKSASATAQVLQRFYDRFVGPRY